MELQNHATKLICYFVTVPKHLLIEVLLILSSSGFNSSFAIMILSKPIASGFGLEAHLTHKYDRYIEQVISYPVYLLHRAD
jgi:hypothetical protein